MNDPAPTLDQHATDQADIVDTEMSTAVANAEAQTNEAPTEEAEKIDVEAIVKHISEHYDFDVDPRAVAFHFKSVKDKETGTTTKRESITLALPYPSIKGIVTILEKGGKGLELLREAVDTVITQHARAMITDDDKLNAATLPVEKLSWEFIANMPKPERTGGGIPKEMWEAFVADYIDIMPEATGKTTEQVANAGKILLNKFAQCKTNLPVLQMLTEQLAVYAEKSEDFDTYATCVEFLVDKADKLLNVTEEDLLEGL